MLSIWSCPKNCCLVKMQQVLMHLSEMNRLHRVLHNNTINTFEQEAGIKLK